MEDLTMQCFTIPRVFAMYFERASILSIVVTLRTMRFEKSIYQTEKS